MGTNRACCRNDVQLHDELCQRGRDLLLQEQELNRQLAEVQVENARLQVPTVRMVSPSASSKAATPVGLHAHALLGLTADG